MASQKFDRRPATLPCLHMRYGVTPIIEFDATGTVAECQQLLAILTTQFDATTQCRLESGHTPDDIWMNPAHADGRCWDKEKGYWDVTIGGETLLLMRDRGRGMCLFGQPWPSSNNALFQVARDLGIPMVPLSRWQARVDWLRSKCGAFDWWMTPAYLKDEIRSRQRPESASRD